MGNWLSAEQVKLLLRSPNLNTIRGERDRAIIALLAGCGLRRFEAAALDVSDIQKRDERWVIIGTRLVYAPEDPALRHPWVSPSSQPRFLPNLGEGITEKVIWCIAKELASKPQIGGLAPHDLRRTCVRLCHLAGGTELEQIQFLLGHVSVQTTEKYLGCKHKLRIRGQRPYRHRTNRFELHRASPPSGIAHMTGTKLRRPVPYRRVSPGDELPRAATASLRNSRMRSSSNGSTASRTCSGHLCRSEYSDLSPCTSS